MLVLHKARLIKVPVVLNDGLLLAWVADRPQLLFTRHNDAADLHDLRACWHPEQIQEKMFHASIPLLALLDVQRAEAEDTATPRLTPP